MPPQNMNPIEPTNRSHRILVLSLAVILTGAIIGGTTYYGMSQNAKKDKAATDKVASDLQKQIDDLKKTETVNSTSTPVTEAADWHIYKNTDYGFQLTLTDNWKNYKVAKKSTIDPSESIATYYFGLPTTGTSDGIMPEGYYSFFAVGVYTKVQWAEYEKLDQVSKDTLGIQNDKYVLAWNHAQSAPSDFTNEVSNPLFKANSDVSEIIKTLSFIK